MPKAIDISGKRFTRLVAIAPTNERRGGKVVWSARCDCGRSVRVTGHALVTGNTRSCGCLKLETTVENGRRNKKHGMHGSPTYRSWSSMRTRCENRNQKGFAYWGGAGVRVCKRWRSFELFLADMGERPSLHHSLDRYPDPNGNYEPGNVRWATSKEQQHNRRDSVVIEAFGLKLSLYEWEARNGVKSDTIQKRLMRGWSPERAVSG